MGSQQLLIIVLGVIVVGVAIAVGIAVFSGNASQANKDAICQDLLQMASSAQAYYRKPALLGGGGLSYVNISFAAMGFEEEEAGVYTNDNAEYTLLRITSNALFIVGRSTEVENAYVVIRIRVEGTRLFVLGWGEAETVS